MPATRSKAKTVRTSKAPVRSRTLPTRKPTRRTRAASPRAYGYDEVARLAYQLWEQRGRTHGSDQNDWMEAESLLRSKRAR